MKRILLFILSITYLVVASGMVISIHYCMGRQTGLDYHYASQSKCEKCGMENKPGCCHNEFKFVKLALDQQLVKDYAQSLRVPALDQPLQPIENSRSLQSAQLFTSRVYHSPPDPRETSIYRYHCLFRI